jgi:hypothetical protein
MNDSRLMIPNIEIYVDPEICNRKFVDTRLSKKYIPHIL